MAGGAGSWDGCHVRTKGTSSPAATSNSDTDDMPSPWTSTGVSKHRASGPPTAVILPSPARRTHGTIEP